MSPSGSSGMTQAWWLRTCLTMAAVLWAVTIVVTPALRHASAERDPSRGRLLVAAVVHGIGAHICHQRPDRTFRVRGSLMPVCGRCAGLYVAGAIGLLAGGVWRRPHRAATHTSRALLAAAAVPTLATWTMEVAGVWNPGTPLRALAALPLGAAAGWVCARALLHYDPMSARQASSSTTLPPLPLCAIGWLVPGAAHMLLGRREKGVIFLVVLVALFAAGVALEGRIFPIEPREPLVALAALADLGIGAPYFVAWALGLGSGTVVAASYEYANTYLIVAGLLNALVVLDAYDIAIGRKA